MRSFGKKGGAAHGKTLSAPGGNRGAKIVEKGIREDKIAGACVAVLHDQEQLLFRAYGMADKERQIPMRTDSIFRIFSMTKPVTAVVTMQLLEDGLLELSDPVSWYIPSFREKMVDADGKLVPANREIRIQDLLNMTSGIPYPDQWSVSQKRRWAHFMTRSTGGTIRRTRWTPRNSHGVWARMCH